MRIIKGYLIIRNGNDVRWRASHSGLAPNEVAVEVVIKAPTPPRLIGKVELELPEPPPAEVSAEVAEYGS